MRYIFLLLLLTTSYLTCFSQRTIRGTITAINNSPLPFVVVKVKGTTIGTFTDTSGAFRLTIPDSLIKKSRPVYLIVSATGFQSQLVQLADYDSVANLRLYFDASSLDEVVVTSIKPRYQEIVSFPWPPPEFSCSTVLDQNYFSNAHSLGDISGILLNALNSVGYSDRSYYYIPNGFALVTRIEQINEDGESLSGNARWSARTATMGKLSWRGYLRSLFFPTPGYFRIIVFAVTNKPFTSSGKKIGRDDASAWFHHGFNVLPEEIAMMRFRKNYACTALIYEYKKPESDEAILDIPSIITAGEHMERSKIIQALKRK